MKETRLEILKKVISRWEVDIAEGKVVTRYGEATACLSNGYKIVSTAYRTKNYQFCVHEVIAFAGGLDLLNKTVDHVNGNKKDNRIENLEVVSRRENHSRATKMGLMAKGSKNASAVLNEEKVVEILKKYRSGESSTAIGAEYGVSRQIIWRIGTGRSWAHVKV